MTGLLRHARGGRREERQYRAGPGSGRWHNGWPGSTEQTSLKHKQMMNFMLLKTRHNYVYWVSSEHRHIFLKFIFSHKTLHDFPMRNDESKVVFWMVRGVVAPIFLLQWSNLEPYSKKISSFTKKKKGDCMYSACLPYFQLFLISLQYFISNFNISKMITCQYSKMAQRIFGVLMRLVLIFSV